MGMSSRTASDIAFARAERAWLTPPDDDECVVCQCDKCGRDMYEGEIIYEDYEGKMVCDDCIADEVREHGKELEAPEPDWDSMPGGADYCDW